MEWLWIGYLSKESVLDTEKCTFCFPKWNELRNGNLFLQTQRLKSNVNGSQRGWDIGMLQAFICWKTVLKFYETWHTITWCNWAKTTMPFILVCEVPSVVAVLAGCRVPAQEQQLCHRSALGQGRAAPPLQRASLKTLYVAVTNCW